MIQTLLRTRWLNPSAERCRFNKFLSGVATGLFLHKQLPSSEEFEFQFFAGDITQCRSALQNRSKSSYCSNYISLQYPA